MIDLNGYRTRRGPATVGDAMTGFADAVSSAGLGRPEIHGDGKLHRFDVPDKKKRNRNGWYVLFLDNIPAGCFGSWDKDFSENWSAKAPYEMTREELDRVRERQRQAMAHRQAEREREMQAAASKATAIYAECQETDDSHPYLKLKQVKPFGGARIGKRGALVVPMYDCWARMIGIQRIFPDGKKLFLPGQMVTGAFTVIDGDRSTTYLCEGYATGASIHMATGAAVVVVFNAGNLGIVARAIKKEVFPQTKLIIAADNDRWTTRPDGREWNVGVEKAKAAAAELGVEVVVPEFRDLSDKPTDFNDLHVLEGLEAVRRQLRPTNFSLISFSDIMDMEFEERPVAEGLLDETENLLIIGPSNIGKSLFTINLALFLASPRDDPEGIDLNNAPALFDLFPVPRTRRVLFLQSENTAKATKKRLSLILKDRSEAREALGNIVVPMVGGGDCRIHGPVNSSFFEQARAIIRSANAEVVIVDPLISFHDCDENDNVSMRAALDRFNDLAQLTGASLVIVHHTGKDSAKGGRGASAIRDWYDNALIIDKAHSDEGRFVLRVVHDKSRNYRLQAPFFLERTPNLDFQPVDDPEIYLVTQAIRNANGVIYGEAALIETMEMLTPAEMSRTHWQRVIKRALFHGLIEKNGERKNQSFTLGRSI